MAESSGRGRPRGPGYPGRRVRQDRSPLRKGRLRFAVGHYLKSLRLSERLTLKFLAKELNTSHTTIARLESGEQTMDLEWLEKFANFYEMQPEDIISGGGDLFSDFKARWIGSLALLGEAAAYIKDAEMRDRIEQAMLESETHGLQVTKIGLRFDLQPIPEEDDDET